MFGAAFNTDTGAGVIDPFRVTNNVRWGGAANPLDDNLIFSALYPGAIAEEFLYTNPGNPNGAQPRWTTTRRYSTYPLLSGIWVNTSGERFYAGGASRTAANFCRMILRCDYAGNGYFNVGADINTTFSAGGFIRSGYLRLYAIGFPQ